MAEELLNGREPLDWERVAVERGRRQERDRCLESLAGLLTGEPVERVPRPVTDIAWEFP